MSDPDVAQEKLTNDQMHVGSDDPVGDIAVMAANPDSDDDEIMEKLTTLADAFTLEEIFAALVRFDSPDVLG